MGPLHSSSIAVGTGISPGSRPWTSRRVRVPLNQLSRSMQFTHQLGVPVESVDFDYESGSAAKANEKAAKTRAQAVPKEATKDAPTKPKRRLGRRKR